jgi:hypothetical protein
MGGEIRTVIKFSYSKVVYRRVLSFVFLHTMQSFVMLREHTAFIFRVTQLVEADADMMQWKRMCWLYREV